MKIVSRTTPLPDDADYYESLCGDEAQIDPIVDHPPTTRTGDSANTRGLDPAFLHGVAAVRAEGQQIERDGIRYLVPDLVPAYGMLGMLVAFAKVGKTSLGQALADAVATGGLFLDRQTIATRVLIVAAEDPPEYTAYLSRHLTAPDDAITFYRAPILLNDTGLQRLTETITDGQYGFVLIASWQAVIRGLVKDENDNAGGVIIVESVKAAARASGIPWLIDAHSGKGENQEDDADPIMALRGASGAAGAADYILSLRYADGTFGNKRRLSGKGRFVNLSALTLDYDPMTGRYTSLGGTKDATTDTTWRLIQQTGAVDQTPRSITDIARRCGLINGDERLGGNHRRQVAAALGGRPEVGKLEELRRGQKATLYRLLEVM